MKMHNCDSDFIFLKSYLTSEVKVGVVSEIDDGWFGGFGWVFYLEFIFVCQGIGHDGRQFTRVVFVPVRAYIGQYQPVVFYFGVPDFLE